MRRVQDPQIRSLIETIRAAQMSRRQLLSGFGAAAAGLGAASLIGCSTGASAGDGSAGTVRWGNWTYYLDYDEDAHTWPTLDRFQANTNIAVEYFEDIDDNKMFIAKIKDQLALGQDTGYDVFCLTDSSLVRLFERDELREFDRATMPNVSAQMIDMVKHATFDPNRVWSIPYQAGMTGLCYNTELFPQGVRSVSDLWQPELAGKVSLLSEQADTISLVMLDQGVDITGDWGDDQFYAALEVVEQQIKAGQIGTIKGNSYTQDLQNDSVLAAMCWSGDIAMLNDEAGEERWKFVIPDGGATLFIDSFCMPQVTDAVEQTQQLIDYYYEPEVAAEVAAYVQYVTPVAGAREAMDQIDPELAENPLIFPDEEMTSRVFDMRSLTSQEDKKYSEAYQRVLAN